LDISSKRIVVYNNRAAKVVKK